MLQRLAPLLVATALLAGGCATETTPDSEKILIESSSSPLGPSKGDGKPKANEAKPKKKPKAKAFTAQQAGITFRAPAGWRPIDKNALDFAADSPRGKELAERTGFTPEQVRVLMESVDVFLTGFAGALTVGALNSSGTLPSESTYRGQFGTLDATIDPATTVNTPLGTGRVHSYELRVSGTVQRGHTLYVLNGSTVVEITIAGPESAAARSVLDQIIPSLKRA